MVQRGHDVDCGSRVAGWQRGVRRGTGRLGLLKPTGVGRSASSAATARRQPTACLACRCNHSSTAPPVHPALRSWWLWWARRVRRPRSRSAQRAPGALGSQTRRGWPAGGGSRGKGSRAAGGLCGYCQAPRSSSPSLPPFRDTRLQDDPPPCAVAAHVGEEVDVADVHLGVVLGVGHGAVLGRGRGRGRGRRVGVGE